MSLYAFIQKTVNHVNCDSSFTFTVKNVDVGLYKEFKTFQNLVNWAYEHPSLIIDEYGSISIYYCGITFWVHKDEVPW